jgi:hypothetical protein
VTWKYLPVYVFPSARVAVIEPDTSSELFHVKVTGWAPLAVEPEPVPIVAQPAAPAAINNNAAVDSL